MGYHVSILRTRSGVEDPLREEEVRALVGVVPGLSIEGPSLARATLDVVIPGSSGRATRLLLQHGTLWAKNPEDHELEEMLRVASLLTGARVRGDELETYRTVTDTYVHPDDRAEVERGRLEVARVVRRRRVIGAVKVIAMAGLLLVLIARECRR